VIILHGESEPTGLILVDSKGRKLPPLMLSSSLPLAGGVLTLNRIFQAQHGILFAAMSWKPEHNPGKTYYLALDHRLKRHNQVIVGPDVYTFVKTVEEAAIHAMVRHNPSIPYMLVSMILLGSGCLLMIPWGQKGKPACRNRSSR
jgi:hypothetical protein